MHRGTSCAGHGWHLGEIGADGGQQRAWVEGFGDVAITPGLEGLDVIPAQGVRRSPR